MFKIKRLKYVHIFISFILIVKIYFVTYVCQEDGIFFIPHCRIHSLNLNNFAKYLHNWCKIYILKMRKIAHAFSKVVLLKIFTFLQVQL